MGAEVDSVNSLGNDIPCGAVKRIAEIIVAAISVDAQLDWPVGTFLAEELRTYHNIVLLCARENDGCASAYLCLAKGEIIMLVLQQGETCQFLVACRIECHLGLGCEGVVLLATEHGGDGFHLVDIGIRGLDTQPIASQVICREVGIAQIHPAHVECGTVETIHITEISGITQSNLILQTSLLVDCGHHASAFEYCGPSVLPCHRQQIRVATCVIEIILIGTG